MRLYLIAVLLIFKVSGYCQNRLELDSLFADKYKTAVLDSLQWQKGTFNFTYLKNSILYFQNNKSGKEKEIITLDELKKITGFNFEQFPSYTWRDAITLTLSSPKYFAIVDMKTEKMLYGMPIDSGAINTTISRNGNIAYSLDSALIVIDSTGTKSVIDEAGPNICSGCIPYRSEFGTDYAMKWSPSGNKLLFYRVNQNNVSVIPLLDTAGMPKQYIHYPFAGEEIGSSEIGLYSVSDKSLTYLKTGKEAGKYLANAVWNPSESSVFISVLNREQNNVQLKEYDAVSGEYSRIILKESNKKYVALQFPSLLLKNKPEFLWLSTKSGHNHLYHYDAEGLLLSQLTTGDWDITQILGMDNKEENVYFVGTKINDQTGRYIYRANLISLQVQCLTDEPGTHTGLVNFDNGLLLDYYTSYTVPAKYTIVDTKGKLVRTVLEVATPFKFVDLPTIEQGTLRADDRVTDLFYNIYKPADFDSEKLYPVIFYVYGGPHVQLVRNRWMGGSGMTPFFLAQEGYIVFVLDNRGSAGRGSAFEQSTFQKLGQIELEDQLAGLKHLTHLTFIDEKRVGVWGWSYGGFMALNMAINAPAKFKAAFSGAPVTNWARYEAMYTERFMSTPAKNIEGYAWSNMIDKAGQLESNVLVISGNEDVVTVPIQHKEFADAALAAGKNVRLETVSNQSHKFSGNARKDLVNEIIAFFNKNL